MRHLSSSRRSLSPSRSRPSPAAQPSDQRRSGSSATFIAMPCPDFFPAKRQVDCGFVRVPEDRTKPHGRTIKVAAAVIRAKTEQPSAAPIVFLDGGPELRGDRAVRAERLLLGLGRCPRPRHRPGRHPRHRVSEPRFGCPRARRGRGPGLLRAADRSTARRSRSTGAPSTARWRRLVREGVDPRAYTERRERRRPGGPPSRAAA